MTAVWVVIAISIYVACWYASFRYSCFIWHDLGYDVEDSDLRSFALIAFFGPISLIAAFIFWLSERDGQRSRRASWLRRIASPRERRG